MSYYIQLETVSLNQYKAQLKTMYLIPSQKILLEDIDQYFECFKEYADHMLALHELLKTKKKVEKFSEISGVSINYLTVLRRHINADVPKPEKISALMESQAHLDQFSKHDIYTAVDLYDYVKTHDSRVNLSKTLLVPLETLEALTGLIDLLRLRWVGIKFARFLLKSRFNHIEKIQLTTGEALYSDLIELNNRLKIYKGAINRKDMDLLVEIAKEIPCEIEYERS